MKLKVYNAKLPHYAPPFTPPLKMSKNCQTILTLLNILPPTFAKTNIVHLCS